MPGMLGGSVRCDNHRTTGDVEGRRTLGFSCMLPLASIQGVHTAAVACELGRYRR